MRVGLLLIRMVVGMIFIVHGVQKIFSGFKIPIEMVTDLGFPAFLGVFLALGELLGGIGLIIGFLLNYASLGLTLIMLGALIFVHIPQGYFKSEFPLILLISNISIMISYNWKRIFQPF